MRYFIGLTTPEELSQSVTKARRQFGEAGERAIQRLEPHLTLVLPFNTDVEPAVITKQLKDAVADHEPFDVTITKVDSFRRGMYYLGVKSSKQLSTLQNKLFKLIEGDVRHQLVRDHYVFRPHVTVVSHLSDGQVRTTQSIADSLTFDPTTWTVDGITLFRYVTDHWERDITVPFNA